ncbi:helix-turn-helix domain-containing protein [Actinomadura flavalba]|uniref:helix-turn-helix domain-containing protein n=1 Tax=Actinomadura flavalba TaxID=1120938 RepID=UPI00037626A2|nr:PucR family transcriptional regulator [Actinomadura flavalba]
MVGTHELDGTGCARSPVAAPPTTAPVPGPRPDPDDESASARVAALLAEVAPGITREAAATVRREVPAYAGVPDDAGLETAVGIGVGHFVDLISRPHADETAVLAFFTRLGADETRAGRGLLVLQNAVNVAARVLVRHLTRALAPWDLISTAAYGRVIEEVFPFVNRIMAAAARGHEQARGGEDARDLDQARRMLLAALTAEAEPSAEDLARLARAARWTVPSTVAVVVLAAGDEPPRRPQGLAPDVLDGLDLTDPCLIVPDPDGPGRRARLRAALTGLPAALGPTVPAARAARSLAWARRTLDLAGQGSVGGDGLLEATDHMPTLVILQDPELVTHIAVRRLAPLRELRPGKRHAYADTLRAVMEHSFNAQAAAERLLVHPQTIRTRMRRLDELFQGSFHDPDLHLEFLIVLRAWLDAAAPDTDPPWFTPAPSRPGAR